MDSIKDYLSSVVSYSLLFKIHTTLHLTKFTVEYSSSLGIINGNSYSFFFLQVFLKMRAVCPQLFSWVEMFLLVITLTQIKEIFLNS